MTTDREPMGSDFAERYRRVVETATDAIIITDLERRIAFANPSAITLFGYGPALIGMTAARTMPEEQRELVREREDRALSGTPQRYECTVMRADGERRLVEVATAPLEERGRLVGIVASLRDVTAERRARDAVIQSEARYRNLFETATDAICTVDLDGSFTSVNEATVQLSGWTRTDLLGRSCRLLFDADEFPAVEKEFRRALAGHAVRFECRLRRADGEQRLVSVTNTPIRAGLDVVGVLGVAARRHRRARACRRARALGGAIHPAGGIRVRRHLHRGCERALHVGEPLARARRGPQPRGTARRARSPAWSTRATWARRSNSCATPSPASAVAAPLRYHSADGGVRHGSLITSPVVEDDAIVGALGIVRDVTDEQRLAEQLLQQEKLAAVGQLVSGVAHELNNPLAGVMAFSQLLLVRRRRPRTSRRGKRSRRSTTRQHARRRSSPTCSPSRASSRRSAPTPTSTPS